MFNNGDCTWSFSSERNASVALYFTYIRLYSSIRAYTYSYETAGPYSNSGRATKKVSLSTLKIETWKKQKTMQQKNNIPISKKWKHLMINKK